ncbi:hypothetical protein NP493_670g01040 [Ridgeia piscesae]|uniref:Uncharacterized protein n=1 Tax=Ridgeia piscesae TaxID=27915 RepID=A0AAD9KT89_RIDPI|nr:hypothetical protein NP493_670g01040 [Ridgeia piscesae]
MPKMIVSATGDEFFLPDDTHYYFDDLPQPTYMMFCENAEHTLLGHHDRIMSNIASLFVSIKTTNTTGTIMLKTSKTPKAIRYWSAQTLHDGRRDFRLVVKAFPYIHPVIWGDGPVEDLGNNEYRVELNKVPGDWVGFYIAMTFDGPMGKILEMTTEIHIIPDTFPFPPCHGVACKGTLVPPTLHGSTPTLTTGPVVTRSVWLAHEKEGNARSDGTTK